MPRYFSNMNVQDCQVKNLVLDQLTSDPTIPALGQLWINTTGGLPKVQLSTRTMLISDQYVSAVSATGVLSSTIGLTPTISITSSATAGQALLSGGSGVAPSFGPLNLAGGASVITGVLPIANMPSIPNTSLASNTITLGTTAIALGATVTSIAGLGLTGVPTAPTAAVNTSSTQIATTAFVLAQLGSAAPLINGTATSGTSTLGAHQDHAHPVDTTRAAVASPTFTGVVTAPTITALTQFTGPGTGLTGTASSLSIGGNAATVTTNANLSGDVTSVGNVTTLASSIVSGKVLTGFSISSASAIVAADTILSAMGKIQAQLNAVSGALVYQGVWNAATNTPALVSGAGTKGYCYKVNTPGTTLIDGNSSWNTGDMLVFDGTTWDKIDGLSTEVTSVAGRVGAIVLTVADISGVLPIAQGGTGATTAVSALAALGGVGKATGLIGDGSTLTYSFNHGLNLAVPNACHIDVTIEATGEKIIVDTFVVDANHVTISYGSGLAPATNTHRVTVIG